MTDTVPRTVFLDFEASSLAKKSYPIEVAWVFEDGEAEAHLIRPAPIWSDWSDKAEAIHKISRATLLAEGRPHDEVARRMVDRLSGHKLYATAPSWDGQWLSKLLRAADLPRHALRLADTEEAHRLAIRDVLRSAVLPDDARPILARSILAQARELFRQAGEPAHRALADAQLERERWLTVRRMALEAVAAHDATP